MKIILLAGGSGNRLWPLSRPSFAKQFLKFGGEESLLQKTVQRFLKKYPSEDLVILTQKEMIDQVKKEVIEIDPGLASRVIAEPSRRNTAPAILFALKWLDERQELGETFLVAPCDHLIAPEELFLEKVAEAQNESLQNSHIAFGVYPNHPHTGYGYIECEPGKAISKAFSFLEKPSLPKAKQLLRQGNCLWNCGIFLFHTEQFFADISEHQPEMDLAFQTDLKSGYNTLPSLSIDYALVEHTRHLKVVSLHLSWSDVGSWDSVYEMLDKDEVGNATIGNGVHLHTKNSLFMGTKRLIASADVEDLLVIDSEDALLITKRGSSQKVKQLVTKLQETGAKQVKEHPTTHRPWGSYTVLEESETMKIKKIVVKPGGKLSLQYHHHRSEHWVVTLGTALITLGEETIELKENMSLFVPKKMVHRLANQTDEPVEMIEVQMGEYVGEDDIVRLDDIYGRLETHV